MSGARGPTLPALSINVSWPCLFTRLRESKTDAAPLLTALTFSSLTALLTDQSIKRHHQLKSPLTLFLAVARPVGALFNRLCAAVRLQERDRLEVAAWEYETEINRNYDLLLLITPVQRTSFLSTANRTRNKGLH